MKYADKLFGVFQRLHREDELKARVSGLPRPGELSRAWRPNLG